MRLNPRGLSALAVAATGLAGALAGPAAAEPGGHGPAGHVYTETNSPAGNSVLVFDRDRDGRLSPAGSVATGGTGTGAGLGSQSALARSGDLLFAVNAGSNDLSVLRVRHDGLRLVDRVASGGTDPISVAVRGRLVYVLNNGGAGNISGFVSDHDGDFRPLAGSTRALAGSGPAQVAFTPNGDRLVVTEKASNTIDTFALGRDGRPGPAVSHSSSGATPFGFDFDRHGDLIVSEAAGGPSGTSAVSSYDLSRGGFSLVSPSVPNGQGAACWVLVSKSDRFAFAANTGSGTVSSYRIGHDGSLTLVAGSAEAVGGSAIDLAQSDNGRFLYSLTTGKIAGARQNADGSLSAVNDATGIPAGDVGLAAD
jgi:6-phosphogluconolactonase